MCGILLVQSQDSIPIEQHLQAFARLQNRGPDFSRYQYQNNTFIGQSVLHITGSADYYHLQHKNFLAYNGEIYNYKEFGSFQNDIEFVHHAVENQIELLRRAWGPWAWAWVNGDKVTYATDPQGERCLYQYQDKSILIVCSEIVPILDYVDAVKIDLPYKNKTWNMLDQTPWSGVIKISPGKLYQNGHPISTIDSIWDWVTQPNHHTMDEAYEDFCHRWQSVTRLMTPECPAALTYSGGLDSSIILSHIHNLELYSVNNLGKDPIVDRVRDFLTPQEQSRLHEIPVNESEWAQEFLQLMAGTQLPVLSWSWVGQWIATRHCQQRILFTGTGADELFGGYDAYKMINYTVQGPTSPYSEFGDHALWQHCLRVYDNDPRQATLLMDYWYQVVGCDARGTDAIGGAWGIETRNPFLAQPVMQFALNLPMEFKVGSVTKPLIRRLFLERWDPTLVFPKKGFTGHANDALPWLPFDIVPTGDRMQDWRQIARKGFYAGH